MLSIRNLIIHGCRSLSNASSSGVNCYTSRTHTCEELSIKNKDEKVSVMGWLSYKRMNRFLILRDAYGSVQVTLPENSKFVENVNDLSYETVIRVDGVVKDRGSNRNKKMKTGEIEIIADNLTVLNAANKDIPMLPDANASERTRLKYRYIDLRTDRMQKALRMRSEFVHNVRKFLIEKNKFVDVETPTLFRRTPGGAAEFVVPASPPNSGLAYSLPQSPQQFKQLLMIGAIDRYFQIARCYRDEGSKGDRQPEFTQIDIEMSFTTQDDVTKLIEDFIVESWPNALEDVKPNKPFRRLTYERVMKLYGIDKPDLRIPWVIEEATDVFKILKKQEVTNWAARVIVCRGASSKMNITNSKKTEWKRLIQMNSNGQPFAVLSAKNDKWFKQIEKQKLVDKFKLTNDDIIIVCWGASDGVQWTLGQLRNYIGQECGLRSTRQIEPLWVTKFPLFTMEDGVLTSTHHPFTAPIEEHEQMLAEGIDLEKIEGQHYDLVINGIEMGGGSIRIHNSGMQQRVLNILNEPTDDMQHLLEALSNGAPPHGGFALGLDRFIALLAAEGDSSAPVRDVIAFPKTKNGNDIMSDAPTTMSSDQMKRYSIKLIGEQGEQLVENS